MTTKRTAREFWIFESDKGLYCFSRDRSDTHKGLVHVREVLSDEISQRKHGWSDVLKLVLHKDAIKFINNDQFSRGEFRDWLESQLHIIDAAIREGKKL